MEKTLQSFANRNQKMVICSFLLADTPCLQMAASPQAYFPSNKPFCLPEVHAKLQIALLAYPSGGVLAVGPTHIQWETQNWH